MQALAERFDPPAIEAATRAFWAGRAALRNESRLGPPGGPTTHEIVGTLFPTDDPFALWHRELLADVEARYLALAGRRSWSTVQVVAGQGPPLPEILSTLRNDGFHLEIDHMVPPEPEALNALLQGLVEGLARRRLLVCREAVAMSCPRCRLPRSPEAIIYQQDDGPAYLLRFPIRGSPTKASLLVWTDYTWRLLGTTAIGVNPDQAYVTGRFRRRETEEVIVIAKEAIPRLHEWLPGGEFEILEERTGAAWAGTGYDHPLSVEYPAIADLTAPAGTVVAAPEVTLGGSGLVTLVPAHGTADAAVGARLGLPGLPVTTADGRIGRVVMHKYAGLPLEIAEAFILRDLNDGGSIFTELRTPRGVPHCVACGSPLIWLPARTWFLEPGRLAPEHLQQFARLLPGEPVPTMSDLVGWVAAKGSVTSDGSDPTLLECDRCELLASPEEAGECPCGGNRQLASRGLATALRETMTAWARHQPFQPGDPVDLILPDRRRAPALVHHLAAIAASGVRIGELHLLRVPTTRPPDKPGETPRGIDARRVALVRTLRSPRVGSTLADRELREARRLARAWHLVRSVVDQALRDGYLPSGESLANHRGELLEEDAAFVSVFERMRAQVLRQYQDGHLGEAAGTLGDFLERDVRGDYLRLVGPRLRTPGLGPAKVSVYRVLWHVLPLWTELYAPVAPFTMEAVHRAFRGDAQSVFERTFTPVQETLIDSKAEEAARPWRQVVDGLARARKEFGISREARLENAVLVAREEEMGGALRASLPMLSRLALVTNLQIASPSQPWNGAQFVATPVLDEIHRVYPSESARIARLLQQIKPRRIQEGLAGGNLSVALDGRSLQILPGMVEISESLPEHTVVVPWAGGEIYLTLPSVVLGSDAERPPAVSVEASQMLREVRRRLTRISPHEPPPRAVMAASGALSNELAARTAASAHYLGVGDLTVSPSDERFVRSETIRGRTRRGAPWAVWFPGVLVPRRPRKRRTPRSGTPRVRVLEVGQEGGDVDFLSEPVVHQAETIRSMLEQLDSVVGRPFVGPTKLANAWAVGIHDYESLQKAPFELLSGVPGFGPIVAGAVVRSFGGTLPPRSARVRPSLHPSTAAAIGPPAVREAAGADRLAQPVQAPVEATASVPLTVPAEPPPPAVALPPSPPATPAAPNPWSDSPPPPPPPTSTPVQSYFVPSTPPPRPVEFPVEEPWSPPTPAVFPLPPDAEPRFGVEVWPGPGSDPAWRMFLDVTAGGVRGLCFTREFPDRVRGALGTRVVDVAWLSNTGRDGSVRPGDLDAVQARIAQAVSERRVRAVFLGGMEYLLSLHGREKVASFLQAVAGVATGAKARVWVPVNPALVVPGAAEELASQFPPEVSA
ncbi:MAG: class I tRNA ligase family protein [Thermoplasmata archaeon]|nr:class I tRNA ligase family protein [Thermoplasmata archaeon]